METVKKYWWLFLLIPIGGYLIYVYMRAKKEVNASTAKARAAKADYAALKLAEESLKEQAPGDGGNN